MTKIRLNESNSKMIDGNIFITSKKAFSLKKTMQKHISFVSTIVHPQLGKMYRYTGEYSRNIKTTN